MKTSNKILLGFALVILGTVTALALDLRYKADHHLYTEKESSTFEGPRWVAKPIGHATRILVSGGEGTVTVSQSAGDSIWLFKTDSAFGYKVVGDTLEFAGNPRGISIAMRHLNEVLLKGSGDFNITGFKGDSLSIYAALGNTMQLDSLDLGCLRLRGQVEAYLTNSTCQRLWMDSAVNFHAEQDLIGSYKKQ